MASMSRVLRQGLNSTLKQRMLGYHSVTSGVREVIPTYNIACGRCSYSKDSKPPPSQRKTVVLSSPKNSLTTNEKLPGKNDIEKAVKAKKDARYGSDCKIIGCPKTQKIKVELSREVVSAVKPPKHERKETKRYPQIKAQSTDKKECLKLPNCPENGRNVTTQPTVNSSGGQQERKISKPTTSFFSGPESRKVIPLKGSEMTHNGEQKMQYGILCMRCHMYLDNESELICKRCYRPCALEPISDVTNSGVAGEMHVRLVECPVRAVTQPKMNPDEQIICMRCHKFLENSSETICGKCARPVTKSTADELTAKIKKTPVPPKPNAEPPPQPAKPKSLDSKQPTQIHKSNAEANRLPTQIQQSELKESKPSQEPLKSEFKENTPSVSSQQSKLGDRNSTSKNEYDKNKSSKLESKTETLKATTQDKTKDKSSFSALSTGKEPRDRPRKPTRLEQPSEGAVESSSSKPVAPLNVELLEATTKPANQVSKGFFASLMQGKEPCDRPLCPRKPSKLEQPLKGAVEPPSPKPVAPLNVESLEATTKPANQVSQGFFASLSQGKEPCDRPLCPRKPSKLEQPLKGGVEPPSSKPVAPLNVESLEAKTKPANQVSQGFFASLIQGKEPRDRPLFPRKPSKLEQPLKGAVEPPSSKPVAPLNVESLEATTKPANQVSKGLFASLIQGKEPCDRPLCPRKPQTFEQTTNNKIVSPSSEPSKEVINPKEKIAFKQNDKGECLDLPNCPKKNNPHSSTKTMEQKSYFLKHEPEPPKETVQSNAKTKLVGLFGSKADATVRHHNGETVKDSLTNNDKSLRSDKSLNKNDNNAATIMEPSINAVVSETMPAKPTWNRNVSVAKVSFEPTVPPAIVPKATANTSLQAKNISPPQSKFCKCPKCGKLPARNATVGVSAMHFEPTTPPVASSPETSVNFVKPDESLAREFNSSAKRLQCPVCDRKKSQQIIPEKPECKICNPNKKVDTSRTTSRPLESTGKPDSKQEKSTSTVQSRAKNRIRNLLHLPATIVGVLLALKYLIIGPTDPPIFFRGSSSARCEPSQATYSSEAAESSAIMKYESVYDHRRWS